jgi:CRISPR system Cascade subunit CasB
VSEQSESFLRHLTQLAERDHGALSQLRRSLGFQPGAYPPAYPYVERFVGTDRHADDPRRKALYLTAGLFALHPNHRAGTSFASALGTIGHARQSPSIEQRFIALLGTEPDELPYHLRQGVSLLAADDAPCDYVRVLDDLSQWLNPFATEARDQLRQRWARDFYRTYDATGEPADERTPEPTSNQAAA